MIGLRLKTLSNILKQTDLNIRNYEEAIDSIHSGWLDFKQDGEMKFIKVNKVIV